MGTPLRVLFVEDSDDDAALQVRQLQQAGFAVEYGRVDTAESLHKQLEQSWDLVISDYSMPHFKGTDALRIVRGQGLETPFIFVSGTIGEETAVDALKNGAQDYLMKTNLNRLVPAVKRELREMHERKERQRLELQVHQLQRFEAIGRLAGGVAHDFNNVVGAIMGWADIGHGEAEPGSQMQDRFAKIRAQADRAAALTRQLLAFARRQVLAPRNVDLNDLTREAIGLLRNVIGAHIDVQMNLATNLNVIWADAGQVEQVLMNLCLNARDAMPDGGTLTIETRNVEVGEDYQLMHAYAVPGLYVLLKVSDTGTGMNADTLEHIFEPFFTTKATDKGTGLGLATVYGIVKQHKGFIDVDSTPGKGTSFRAYLPLGEGKVDAPEKRRQDKLRGGAETILVAEDNEGLREAAQEILENLGYTVLLAKNGAEAVKLYEQHATKIDLALLDVVMPVMNGPDAYTQMTKIHPDLQVIFTTGYATEKALLHVRTQEKALILQKPYGAQYLAQKLREILDLKIRMDVH